MSTILSADDLNDFIAPGVACIKPVEVSKTSETAAIEIGPDGVPVETMGDEIQKLQTAQISLTDCLACSGCVTSSETVLLELQSPKEMLRVIDEDNKVCVVSISPQIRASLANAFNLSIKQVDDRLLNLFIEKLGFKYAVGTEIGRALALEQTRHEATSRNGPILSSICPGWTLYAEKTHPHVLQYLSAVKSPQQITGNLLKRFVASQGVAMENIYHVSIMPCFDKKLESARPGNVVANEIQEVDLVITAKEIVQMLNEHFETDFQSIPTETNYLTPAPFEASWQINGGSTSGGYLWYVLQSLKQRYPKAEVEEVRGKNSDIVDYNVVVDGQVIWRGAQIYGFRNIQNIVRKLKPGKRVVSKRAVDPLTYGYVEIMACPGGCTNGGGQIGASAGVAPKSWNRAVEELYEHIPSLELPLDIPDLELPETNEFMLTEFKPLEPQDNNIPEALAVGSQW